MAQMEQSGGCWRRSRTGASRPPRSRTTGRATASTSCGRRAGGWPGWTSPAPPSGRGPWRGERPRSAARRGGGVWGVTIDADGRLVASGGYDRTVRVWETEACRLLATLEGHAEAVRWVSLSADGRLLASGGNDGTVRLWEGGQPVDLFRPLD